MRVLFQMMEMKRQAARQRRWGMLKLCMQGSACRKLKRKIRMEYAGGIGLHVLPFESGIRQCLAAD
jgi:hypothetical protein